MLFPWRGELTLVSRGLNDSIKRLFRLDFQTDGESESEKLASFIDVSVGSPVLLFQRCYPEHCVLFSDLKKRA